MLTVMISGSCGAGLARPNHPPNPVVPGTIFAAPGNSARHPVEAGRSFGQRDSYGRGASSAGGIVAASAFNPTDPILADRPDTVHLG
jgi:hypothetical protein